MVAHFASISGVNASPSTPAESTRFDHPSHGSVDDSLLLSLYCDSLLLVDLSVCRIPCLSGTMFYFLVTFRVGNLRLGRLDFICAHSSRPRHSSLSFFLVLH
jgi:hypothetical protein